MNIEFILKKQENAFGGIDNGRISIRNQKSSCFD